MNDGKTPETDAALCRYDGIVATFRGQPIVAADFARKLELERDQARADLEQADQARITNGELYTRATLELAELRKDKELLDDLTSRPVYIESFSRDTARSILNMIRSIK